MEVTESGKLDKKLRVNGLIHNFPPQNGHKEKRRYIQIAEHKTSYNLQLSIENKNATLSSEGMIKLHM